MPRPNLNSSLSSTPLPHLASMAAHQMASLAHAPPTGANSWERPDLQPAPARDEATKGCSSSEVDYLQQRLAKEVAEGQVTQARVRHLERQVANLEHQLQTEALCRREAESLLSQTRARWESPGSSGFPTSLSSRDRLDSEAPSANGSSPAGNKSHDQRKTADAVQAGTAVRESETSPFPGGSPRVGSGMELVSKFPVGSLEGSPGGGPEGLKNWDELAAVFQERRESRNIMERRLSAMWQHIGEEMGALVEARGQEDHAMVQLMGWIRHLLPPQPHPQRSPPGSSQGQLPPAAASVAPPGQAGEDSKGLHHSPEAHLRVPTQQNQQQQKQGEEAASAGQENSMDSPALSEGHSLGPAKDKAAHTIPRWTLTPGSGKGHENLPFGTRSEQEDSKGGNAAVGPADSKGQGVISGAEEELRGDNRSDMSLPGKPPRGSPERKFPLSQRTSMRSPKHSQGQGQSQSEGSGMNGNSPIDSFGKTYRPWAAPSSADSDGDVDGPAGSNSFVEPAPFKRYVEPSATDLVEEIRSYGREMPIPVAYPNESSQAPQSSAQEAQAARSPRGSSEGRREHDGAVSSPPASGQGIGRGSKDVNNPPGYLRGQDLDVEGGTDFSKHSFHKEIEPASSQSQLTPGNTSPRAASDSKSFQPRELAFPTGQEARDHARSFSSQPYGNEELHLRRQSSTSSFQEGAVEGESPTSSARAMSNTEAMQDTGPRQQDMPGQQQQPIDSSQTSYRHQYAAQFYKTLSPEKAAPPGSSRVAGKALAPLNVPIRSRQRRQETPQKGKEAEVKSKAASQRKASTSPGGAMQPSERDSKVTDVLKALQAVKREINHAMEQGSGAPPPLPPLGKNPPNSSLAVHVPPPAPNLWMHYPPPSLAPPAHGPDSFLSFMDLPPGSIQASALDEFNLPALPPPLGLPAPDPSTSWHLPGNLPDESAPSEHPYHVSSPITSSSASAQVGGPLSSRSRRSQGIRHVVDVGTGLTPSTSLPNTPLLPPPFPPLGLPVDTIWEGGEGLGEESWPPNFAQFISPPNPEPYSSNFMLGANAPPEAKGRRKDQVATRHEDSSPSASDVPLVRNTTRKAEEVKPRTSRHSVSSSSSKSNTLSTEVPPPVLKPNFGQSHGQNGLRRTFLGRRQGNK